MHEIMAIISDDFLCIYRNVFDLFNIYMEAI